MATRSSIARVVPNSNGKKFEARYHHWDGYPDGLGETLATYANSGEIVDAIFKHETSFSTLMSTYKNYAGELETIPQTNPDGDGWAAWPVLSTDTPEMIEWKSEHYMSLHDKGDLDGVCQGTWEEVNDFCQQEYTYIYTDQWNLVLHQTNNFEDVVMMNVADYLLIVHLESVLQDEEEDKEVTQEDEEKLQHIWSNLPERTKHSVLGALECRYDGTPLLQTYLDKVVLENATADSPARKRDGLGKKI